MLRARAARGASVEARDPDALSRSRAVRRHDRRRRSGVVGVSRQTGVAACRMPKRRCSRCCRRRRAGCVRIATRMPRARRATRCSTRMADARRVVAGRSARCAHRIGRRARAAAADERGVARRAPARGAARRSAASRRRSTPSCSARSKRASTDYLARLPERTSAALLVVDNATLEARAYVGSAVFGDEHASATSTWCAPGARRARR